ncbi:hypothetical protein GCM10023353_18610 [Tomitella cavernea]|uniref:Uncharacterized protein n=1 Tax=Tomitella cavernea TaxID=1387982 RepID=A0ABP9CP87_9ACTN
MTLHQMWVRSSLSAAAPVIVTPSSTVRQIVSATVSVGCKAGPVVVDGELRNSHLHTAGPAYMLWSPLTSLDTRLRTLHSVEPVWHSACDALFPN